MLVKSAKNNTDIKFSLKESCGIQLDIPDGVGCTKTTTRNISPRHMNNDRKNLGESLINYIAEMNRENIESILKRHDLFWMYWIQKDKVDRLEDVKDYCKEHTKQ